MLESCFAFGKQNLATADTAVQLSTLNMNAPALKT